MRYVIVTGLMVLLSGCMSSQLDKSYTQSEQRRYGNHPNILLQREKMNTILSGQNGNRTAPHKTCKVGELL